MYQTIIGLKQHIAAVMPLLDANLAAADKEWMAGTLAKGAFDYCSTRHLAAGHIVEANPAELNEEAALAAGARLFLDLRSALKDVPADRRAGEEAKVEGLRKFFVEQGFTAVNSLFNIPMRPTPRAAASVALSQ
jgi:hypothetical protein